MIDVWTKVDDKFNGEEMLEGCMPLVGIERKILASVLWLNIACNVLLLGSKMSIVYKFICWPVTTHRQSTI
jgi:hypothetical protein